MKSNNVIWVILLILFVLLGSMELMLWKQYNKKMESKNVTEHITQSDSSVGNNILYLDPPDEDDEGENDWTYNDEPDTHKYIFVGDSRYVGMSKYAEDYDVFFCENGVGIHFLKQRMSKIVEAADDNTRIIIGLGVNDVYVGNDGYVNAIMDLHSQTDAEIYYMLVNPVNDSRCAASGYPLTNSMIERFNTKMTEELYGSDIKIIDTYTYLTTDGFTTYDGLHYDDETSKKIYDFIKRCIRNQ